VDPGDHTITVEAPGRARSTTTLSLRETERREVTVEQGPAEAARPAASR
jgi:hypothetical protein